MLLRTAHARQARTQHPPSHRDRRGCHRNRFPGSYRLRAASSPQPPGKMPYLYGSPYYSYAYPYSYGYGYGYPYSRYYW